MPSFAIIVALIAICIALALANDASVLTIGAGHSGQSIRLHHTARLDRAAQNPPAAESIPQPVSVAC
jgi:hypothetical protein